jgi:hypothetical protein
MPRCAALVISTLALVATACSGDSAGTAYYEGLREVAIGYENGIALLPAATTDGSLRDALAYFNGIDTAAAETAATLAGLLPPESATSAHYNLRDRMDAFAELAGRVAAQGRRMREPADLIRLANDPVFGVANFGAVRAGVVAACEELQELADDNGGAVDLRCDSFSGR